MLAKFGEVTFTSFVHMIINRSLDICKEMKSCNYNKHWKPYISRYASKVLGYMTFYAPHLFCTSPYKKILKEIRQYNTLLDAGKLSLKYNWLRTGAY